MRTALLSDVHGNAVALDAVLADLERAGGADQVVCLGDMIQGGPYPAEVLALLVERGWPVVLGNADEFLLREDVDDAGVAWTRARLGAEGVAVVGGFAPTVRAALGDGRGLLGFHGSPTSNEDFLLPTTPEGVFRSLLRGGDADVLAGGHVHLPFVRRLGDVVFVNPGSIGASWEHGQADEDFRLDPWGAYGIVSVEGEVLSVELRRVPYDTAAVIEAFRAREHPNAAAWAERLQRG